MHMRKTSRSQRKSDVGQIQNQSSNRSIAHTGDVVMLDEGETSGDGSVPTAGYGKWFWKFQYSSCSVSMAEWVISSNVVWLWWSLDSLVG